MASGALHPTLRLSLSRRTIEADVDLASAVLVRAASLVRAKPRVPFGGALIVAPTSPAQS